MNQTKPFPFERLPHLSRRDVRLAQDVLSCLPRMGFSQKLSTHLSHLLTKELNESILIKREKNDICIKDDLQKRLPPQGVFLVLNANPSPDKIVVELDPLLSFWAIDKLLGGPGELPQSLRTLTEIEEGVLSFLVLKVLALIFEKSGADARVHFRLESLKSYSDDVIPAIDAQRASFVSLYFRVTFGKKSGYVKIYLPDSLVDGTLATESDQKYFEARIHNYEEVPTELWAEVGRATLKGADINALESGDVILLQTTGVQLKGNRLTGVLPLRVGPIGNEQQSQIKARILNDRENIVLRVEGVASSGGSHV